MAPRLQCKWMSQPESSFLLALCPTCLSLLSFGYKCYLFLAWDSWLAPKHVEVQICQIHYPHPLTLQPLSPGLSNKEPSLLSQARREETQDAIAAALNVNRMCSSTSTCPFFPHIRLAGSPGIRHLLTAPCPHSVLCLWSSASSELPSLELVSWPLLFLLLFPYLFAFHVLRAHTAGVRR